MPDNDKYESVIGLEVHAQLITKSKMFCSCPCDYIDALPNTVVCPICLALPGSLPVVNRRAVECVVMTGLALKGEISQSAQFHRKNYSYPDLMKGYQISQYDDPISSGGSLKIYIDGHEKEIGITRVHLEEDVAKLQHIQSNTGDNYSLVDVNRSGVPLMETVSEPDIRSPEEARQYLLNLRSIFQYLGVSTGNMEDGSFRCDANISIRPKGSIEYFTRTEVKNMNSFKSVYRALEYEMQRQIEVVEQGGRVVQETRGWVEEKGITVSQRTKEFAHDYRYFPEPDIPPIPIDPDWVKSIKANLPELPDDRKKRFISRYSLPSYDSELLTSSKIMADYFEDSVNGKSIEPGNLPAKSKLISNWMLGDMAALINTQGIDASESKVTPLLLREFIDLVETGTIRGPAAKEVFEEMFRSGEKPLTIANNRGLTQLNDQNFLQEAVETVINANDQAVTDFIGGKSTAIKFLLGQVMKQTRGRANPNIITDMLLQNLNSKGQK